MAVKIDIQQTIIPVEMGDLTFYFDMGDTSMKGVFKTFRGLIDEALAVEKTEDELEAMTSEELDKFNEESKAFCKKALDYLLGNGAFEKLYALSPSTTILVGYFHAVVDGLGEEIARRNGMEKATKYMGPVGQ